MGSLQKPTVKGGTTQQTTRFELLWASLAMQFTSEGRWSLGHSGVMTIFSRDTWNRVQKARSPFRIYLFEGPRSWFCPWASAVQAGLAINLLALCAPARATTGAYPVARLIFCKRTVNTALCSIKRCKKKHTCGTRQPPRQPLLSTSSSP